MDAALGWLGDIVHAVLQLVPRLLIVPPTHEGAKWPLGGSPKLMRSGTGLLGTGLHFYWPITTEHAIVPVKRQTANLDYQYLVTADNQTVGVGGILVYEVSDTIKLLNECADHEDTIRDHAMAAIKEVITTGRYESFRDNPEETDKLLTAELRGQLRRFGVRTIKVTLSDFSPVRMVALWGGVTTG